MGVALPSYTTKTIFFLESFCIRELIGPNVFGQNWSFPFLERTMKFPMHVRVKFPAAAADNPKNLCS
jgi:hypothetical protein